MQTRSMTGFGKAKINVKNKQIVAEIKSVNSKQLDLNLRLPPSLRDMEVEFRNMIAEVAERGKVEVNLYFDGENSDRKMVLNKQLASNYYSELAIFANDVNANTSNLLALVMNLPEVFKQQIDVAGDDEIKKIKALINTTLVEFNAFRKSEGLTLGKELEKRIQLILAGLKKIEQADGKRLKLIKNRIRKELNEVVVKDKIDHNRFEEELIYYVEKMDITEEKVRLKTHCDYFLNTLKEKSSGRKLGFISQEIGREINTIGSKANDAPIQKIVVQMKDELEKIKEQLMNIL
ncbi:MAG TPA: YicC family protein [Bacteroidia bacterium]|nr:YicC family protein [Bacteroidia bacterium]